MFTSKKLIVTLIVATTAVTGSIYAIAQTKQPIPQQTIIPQTQQAQPSSNRSLAAFKKRDVNGDGAITQEEWLQTVGGRNTVVNPTN